MIFHSDGLPDPAAAPVPASPHAVNSAPASTVPYRPPAVVEATGEPVDVFMSFELMVHYVSDCVYAPLLGGSASLQGMVRAAFLSYFTPASCDPEAEYFVQGKVAVPVDFELSSARPFLKQLQQLTLVDNCSFSDLVGASMAELNSEALASLYAGIEETLLRLGDHTCSKHLSQTFDFLGGNPHHRQLSALVQSSSLGRVKGALRSLLALLPEKIKTDSREISDKMALHKLSHSEGRGGKGESKRRQQNKKAAAKSQSREFDPLWAFALSECLEYNKTAEALHSQVLELLGCQSGVVRFLVDRGVVVSDSSGALERLSAALALLEDGLVPRQWLGGAQAAVKIEDWVAVLAERRHLLHSWLTQGTPSVIRLHLLHDPAGLFHALKETFSLRTETPVEKVHLHHVLLDAGAVSNANIALMNASNHGCTVLLAGVYLHNASYSHKNASMEFLQDFSGSKFGQVRLAS